MTSSLLSHDQFLVIPSSEVKHSYNEKSLFPVLDHFYLNELFTERMGAHAALISFMSAVLLNLKNGLTLCADK